MIPESEWRELEVRLIWAYQGAVEPRHRVCDNPPGGLIRARRLIAGRAWHTCDDRRTEVARGAWVFSPTRPFRQEFSEDAVIESVGFLMEWSAGERLFPQEEFVVLKSTELNEAAATLIDAAGGRQVSARTVAGWAEREAAFARWVRAYVASFEKLGRTAQAHPARDPRVRAAISYLREAGEGRWPGPGELAAQAGLSRGHLNRLFVAEAGRPLAEFLNAQRLARARRCLQEGRSAKEASAACGFASPQAFSKWFRRAAGVAPRGYAHQARGGP